LSVAVNPTTLCPLDGTVVATLFVDEKSASQFSLQDQLCLIFIEVSGMAGDFVILCRALIHLYEIQPINLNVVKQFNTVLSICCIE
jgi:hypothetical protein